MSRFFKSAAFPILIVVVLAFFVQKLVSPHNSEPVPSYGEFITQLDAGQVKTVDVKTKDNTLVVKPRTGAQYERGFLPDNAPSLESRLEKAKAAHKLDDYNIEGTKSNGWLSLLTYVLPFLIFIGFWIFLMNQVQGGGSKVMSFGKSRAKRMSVDSPKITFRDVAGVDEAVEELHEIKEFLENPKKFQALGARIPKGVLLYGPPGTGKTLLARAVAAESRVHFIHLNGPEIMRKFYGESEAKLREVFEEAARRAPAILFIDEIDAVAPKRAEVTGDVEKRVVAQLLSLMDGFVSRGQVIVMGATNIPEVLDPALRRPGRFDREIEIGVPNTQARLQILRIHTRAMPLAGDVDLAEIAEHSHGFVGADVEALCQEVGMIALRRFLRDHPEERPPTSCRSRATISSRVSRKSSRARHASSSSRRAPPRSRRLAVSTR
jgi:cell division protease FtsH